MEIIENSRDNIYKFREIQSCFKNAVKIYPKKKSDNIIEKPNLLLLHRKPNLNDDETAGESDDSKANNIKLVIKSNKNIPKQNKNKCILYKDLVVDSEKSEDSDNHLELAIIIKKRKYTNKSKIKITKCDNIYLNSVKGINNISKQKKSLSMNKVILGSQNKENKIIKKLKKKLLCC